MLEINFNYKLIIDFDSTLVKIETLDKLAEASLLGGENKEQVIRRVEKITNKGMNGEISFSESLEKRVALIKTNRKIVKKTAGLIKKEISPSVLKNINYFKKNSRNIIVVSGGFKELIFPTTDLLGIDRGSVFANDFIFDARDDLTGVNRLNLMAQDNGKVNQIKALHLEGRLIMVGDGWTDYQAKESRVVDRFIAYTENISRDKVTRKADLVANDFFEVIDFLNIFKK